MRGESRRDLGDLAAAAIRWLSWPSRRAAARRSAESAPATTSAPSEPPPYGAPRNFRGGSGTTHR